MKSAESRKVAYSYWLCHAVRFASRGSLKHSCLSFFFCEANQKIECVVVTQESGHAPKKPFVSKWKQWVSFSCLWQLVSCKNHVVSCLGHGLGPPSFD